MNATNKVFGTPTHHLYHRRGPETERAAAHSVDTTKAEQAVYVALLEAPRGLTINECAAQLGRFPNQVSGRFTALQSRGYILDTGLRRSRSRVMFCGDATPALDFYIEMVEAHRQRPDPMPGLEERLRQWSAATPAHRAAWGWAS